MISQLEWSEEQVAVLARAERLRSYGAGRAALDLVACGCVLPTRLRVLDVPLARQLDVGRWYCALMGRPWNGDWRAFQMARDIARRRRNDIDGGAQITPLVMEYTDPAICWSNHCGTTLFQPRSATTRRASVGRRASMLVGSSGTILTDSAVAFAMRCC